MIVLLCIPACINVILSCRTQSLTGLRFRVLSHYRFTSESMLT